MSIAPVLIACKERYAKLATISVPSFLRHHDMPLYVVVDELGYEALKHIKDSNLILARVEKPQFKVIKDVGVDKFATIPYDKLGGHDRVYSSLKPLLMHEVIMNYRPDVGYVLSLDSDSYFSGNIMNRVKKETRDKKDLYMVARTDKRMLTTGSNQPGSGFTMWRHHGKFIKAFRSKYNSKMAAYSGGGSQNLINLLMTSMSSRLIHDPMLHFVSPDLKNPKFPDSEIKKLKPAYIHLHGKNSYERLLRFKRILE